MSLFPNVTNKTDFDKLRSTLHITNAGWVKLVMLIIGRRMKSGPDPTYRWNPFDVK